MRVIARSAIIGLCVIAASGVAAQAYAQRGARLNQDVRKPRFERFAKDLGLSQEQMDKIKALREEGFSQMADLRKEMARVRNDMRGEWLKDNPSEDALKKLVVKESDIRARMETARIEHRLAMRDILTEEQRDKLMMFRGRGGWGCCGDRRGAFRGGRMGHGRGMRGQGRGMGMRGPGQGMGLRDGSCMGFGFSGPGPGFDCPGPMWDDLGPAPSADDNQ